MEKKKKKCGHTGEIMGGCKSRIGDTKALDSMGRVPKPMSWVAERSPEIAQSSVSALCAETCTS